MFGLSFGEVLIILVVALIVLGPQRLPGMAKSLGKGLREFRKATGELRSTMEDEFYKMEDKPRVVATSTTAAPSPTVRPPEGAVAVAPAPAEPAPAAAAEVVVPAPVKTSNG